MTDARDAERPPVRKQSKAKLWIKTGIFAVFGTMFSLALYQDIAGGFFHWSWALMAFIPCLGVGYGLSKLVPMKFHEKFQVVTLSFDRTYFILIFSLVAIKTVSGQLLGIHLIPDLIMCAILGIMVSRIGGIGLRVHSLKCKNVFAEQGNKLGQFSS